MQVVLAVVWNAEAMGSAPASVVTRVIVVTMDCVRKAQMTVLHEIQETEVWNQSLCPTALTSNVNKLSGHF